MFKNQTTNIIIFSIEGYNYYIIWETLEEREMYHRLFIMTITIIIVINYYYYLSVVNIVDVTDLLGDLSVYGKVAFFFALIAGLCIFLKHRSNKEKIGSRNPRMYILISILGLFSHKYLFFRLERGKEKILLIKIYWCTIIKIQESRLILLIKVLNN